MIGGIPKNLGQGALFNDSKYFVIEGDEYDTAFFDKRSKFIHYLPELLIVNNIEFDHADIFDDLEQVKRSFRHLLRIVPQNGMVLLNGDDPNCVEVDERMLRADRGDRIFAKLRAADPRRRLFGRRFALHARRRDLRAAADRRVQCAQRGDGGHRGALLWRRGRQDPGSADELRRHCAAAGSARRSAGREGDRRFRPSSDGDRANADRVAPSLSRASALGDLRAALEHHAPRGLSAGTAGCAEARRRRLHLTSRAAGSDSRRTSG